LLKQPNVTSICGKLTLDQLAAFIAACDGLIASGTGPLHMSAALGQRTLGLFPPLRPIHPGRWAPIGTRAEVLCIDKVCAGCKDPSACACMRAITPQMVADVVDRWRTER
jgi:ADP-heptose:LPS heptosyltransferase